jgi:cytochrome c5
MRTLISIISLGAFLLACSDDDPGATGTTSSQGPQGSGGTAGSGGSGAQGGTGGMGGSDEGCAVDDGQCIFRHDTFGDEQLWTDALRLHELVQTLPPTMALGVGLKVDAAAVPADVLANADLEDPATTVALLELDAVVGVKATVENGQVTQIGITCALCHSTVDDSVVPGVGQRLDGWPNRDLDPGLIISLTPGFADYVTSLGLDPAVVGPIYASWGPGRYDARFNQDLMSSPVLIPPAYGLAMVALETYTGDGPISYWNAYVAVTQMGAQGNFSDPELGIDIMHTPDLVTDKLPALADYQHSLAAPAPPSGSFDAEAAGRGEMLFGMHCASCHSGAAFTDAPTLHTAAEVGQEPTEAMRSKTGMYRTMPLRGVWQRAPYFHDGNAASLDEVVAHYNTLLGLALTPAQQADVVQYLLSL